MHQEEEYLVSSKENDKLFDELIGWSSEVNEQRAVIEKEIEEEEEDVGFE